MLWLTRKPGQRVKITCPDGHDIWLTMRDRWIDCERSGIVDVASTDSAAYYDIGQDTIEIMLRLAQSVGQHHSIGIDAPKSYHIMREELLTRRRYPRAITQTWETV